MYNKLEQWQMWSLQRTENPKELDRNQPAPRTILGGSSVGRTLGLGPRGRRIVPCPPNE